MIVVQSLLGNHYSFGSSLHFTDEEINAKRERVSTKVLQRHGNGSFNFLFLLPLPLPLLLFLL